MRKGVLAAIGMAVLMALTLGTPRSAQAIVLSAPAALNAAADETTTAEKICWGYGCGGYGYGYRPYYRPYYGYGYGYRPYYRPYYGYGYGYRPYYRPYYGYGYGYRPYYRPYYGYGYGYRPYYGGYGYGG